MDLDAAISPSTRAITLFSGGLDSAYLLYLLSRRGCKNVVALTVDLGDVFDPSRLDTCARHFGATLRILDAKKDGNIDVSFEEGIPVAVDGERLVLVDLIQLLNMRVGRFGLGRYSGLAEIATGHKVLEVREMPAAHLLLAAYRQLETATVSAETVVNVDPGAASHRDMLVLAYERLGARA